MATIEGLSAKRFFVSKKKTAKMVQAHRDGLTYRKLEQKFHLKPMNGMSSFRIVRRWARKSPKWQEKSRNSIRAAIKAGKDI